MDQEQRAHPALTHLHGHHVDVVVSERGSCRLNDAHPPARCCVLVGTDRATGLEDPPRGDGTAMQVRDRLRVTCNETCRCAIGLPKLHR